MTTAALPQPTASTAFHGGDQSQGWSRWGRHEWTMLRWGVRATLVLGVAASVAANILHAQPNLIGQAIAAWPPLALLFTVELITRVPVHRRGLAVARLLAATAIAGIAAFVSYWHMVGVAARYGETGASPYLLPLSVDGLIIVASVSLVEISGRLRTAQPDQPASTPQVSSPPLTSAVAGIDVATQLGVPDIDPAPDRPQAVRLPLTEPPKPASVTAEEQASVDVSPTEPATQQAAPAAQPVIRPAEPPAPSTAADASSPAQEPQPRGPADEEAAAQVTEALPTTPAPEQQHDDGETHDEAPAAPRDAIAYWQKRLPGISVENLADRIGKSPRQIRRYLRPPAANVPQQVNGRRNDTLADTFPSPSP